MMLIFILTFPNFLSVTCHRRQETNYDIQAFLFYLSQFLSVTCHMSSLMHEIFLIFPLSISENFSEHFHSFTSYSEG